MEFRFNHVSERDMDLLFLEELSVNGAFLGLFTEKIPRDWSGYEIVSGELSLMDAVLGESDLTVILEKTGHKIALLIEDKINATAQPRQYERYIERGNKGVSDKVFDEFYVFLIAPKEYFGSVKKDEYPLRIEYEACRELFGGRQMPEVN